MELKTYIQIAGLLQLVIVAANFLLPAILHYRQNLAKVSPIIRQIFWGHAAYIVLTVLGFAILSLFLTEELTQRTPLALSLNGFLALFWLSRVVVQTFFYDRKVKQNHPLGNIFFTSVFLYLGLTYLAAAILCP